MIRRRRRVRLELLEPRTLLNGAPVSNADHYTVLQDHVLATTGLGSRIDIDSAPGDTIGQGRDRHISDEDGWFEGSTNFKQGVTIQYQSAYESLSRWRAEFVAPHDVRLQPGRYEGVARWPYREPSDPELNLFGAFTLSTQSSGQFTVLSVEYGPDSRITSFAADFELLGSYASQPLKGSVRYRTEPNSNPSLLDNDHDPDGDALTAHLVSEPTVGTAELRPDGRFTFTPPVGFHGPASFSYRISDGHGDGPETPVTIDVRPSGANLDTYTTREDHRLVVDAPGVLANDGTAPYERTWVVAQYSAPRHGKLNLRENGSFDYEPETNFFGQDSFEYRLSDGQGNTEIGTVSLQVVAENDVPVALADAYRTVPGLALEPEGQRGTRIVLDSDPGDWVGGGEYRVMTPSDARIQAFTSDSGDGVRVSCQSLISDEWWDLNFAAPNFQRLAPGRYEGAMRASFKSPTAPGLDVYGTGRGSNTVTGWFQVLQAEYAGSNLVAFAVDFVQHTDTSDPALRGELRWSAVPTSRARLLVNDRDADGDPMQVLLEHGPTHGTLDLRPNGTFRYLANPGFEGTDAFSYRVSDGIDVSDPATVQILVSADAGGVPDAYEVPEDGNLVVPAPGLLGNEMAVDPGLWSAVELVEAPPRGRLTFQADGSFSYIPDPDFAGLVSLSYRPRGAQGTGSTTLVTINVTPRPDPAQVFVVPVVAGPGVELKDIILAIFRDVDAGSSVAGYRARIDWGDGSPIDTGRVDAAGEWYHVHGTHTYRVAGPVRIGVAVDESDAPGEFESAVWDLAGLRATLDPGSDTGASPTDGITRDATPTVTGVAIPGTLVRLHARQGQGAENEVGSAFADSNGRFVITATTLADGTWELLAESFDADGHPVQAAPVRQIVVDTEAPRVGGAWIDARAGQLDLSVREAVGLDPASWTTSGAVRLVQVKLCRPQSLPTTFLSQGDGRDPAVTLRIGSAKAICSGRFLLRLDGSAIVDLAGNRLDGEPNKRLPSGDGKEGGSFVGLLDVIRTRRTGVTLAPPRVAALLDARTPKPGRKPVKR